MGTKTFKGYWKMGEDGNPVFVEFTEGNYAQAGVPYASLHGIPQLESYELVNRMNTGNTVTHWLATA